MKAKVVILIMVLISFYTANVLAQNKDIEAKYDKIYNVNLVRESFNNETKKISINDLKLEVSTSLSDIEVIIIEAHAKANYYAYGFTNNTANYYLAVYKNGQKVSSSNVNIRILSKDKVLSIYDNKGKILEKSNTMINLTKNDYFFIATDSIDVPEYNYAIIDDGNTVKTIESISIPVNSYVEVYNSKTIKVANTVNLGTNYKVVVTNNNKQSTYTIIVKGDTTGDANINLNDVTRLYHYYKGIEQMDDNYVLAGDVANNQIINLNDITKLYHYYKKLIPGL